MSNSLSPYFTVESSDFGFAFIEALYNVVNNGKDIVFGSLHETKHARDTAQTILLTGEAITQIERGELPELTRGKNTLGFAGSQNYRDEWSREWLESQEALPLDSGKKFVYGYIPRLVRAYGDQLAALREKLAEDTQSGVASNRRQAITWEPKNDLNAESPPCFQRLWFRYYEPNLIDLHLSWRSRDLYNAWRDNLLGAIPALNREIFSPNNCRIARIVDQCDSLHVYHGALQDANELLLFATNNYPKLMERIMAKDY